MQERHGPLRGTNFWKVPTGMVSPGISGNLASLFCSPGDFLLFPKPWIPPSRIQVNPNEDILAAAAREVKEETGVDVIVGGIICLRETHRQHVQGKTDLFFLCKAHPVSTDITPQVSEILKVLPFCLCC